MLGHLKKYRYYFVSILILGFLSIFYKGIDELTPIKAVGSFFLLDSPTFFADAFFLLIFLTSIFILIKRWQERKDFVYRFESEGALPLFLLIIYLPFRLSFHPHQAWHFTGFKTASFIAYADTLLLCFIVLSLHPKKRFTPQSEVLNLLHEDDLFAKVQDVLKREGYAKQIAEVVNQQVSKNSFAIGITGKWGSGKSVFMEQLKTQLKHCVIITFNPWLSKQSAGITEDFFSLVTQTIEEYDSSLAKRVKAYADTLMDVDDSSF